ncbi:MAG TPA: C1 family peptidase [Bryobacteraceae bacterium]|nr:C1 family peptidase [Bryobacteraceae bacterium]
MGDFGDFGDGGDGGDFGNGGGDDGNGFDDQDDQGSDDGQDDDQGDDQDGDDDQGDNGDDGDDDQNDDNDGDQGDSGSGDDQLDDMFADQDDLPPVDDDVFASADDFPNAEPADFADDTGGWSTEDYETSAQNLFGDHPFFGDTLETQKIAEGFQPYQDAAFGQGFDQIVPGASDTVQLFERDGHLSAFGVLSQAALALLMARYTGIDWSNMDVAVPEKGDRVEPQPLPPAFANVTEQPAVDLRKYSTPIGDQGQTGRCSAFAWTHANEMSRNILYPNDSPRLSPNFTMLEFQRMQGDARDYQYAYSGGDGTVSGPEPGELLVDNGTCRQELWPDDRAAPLQNEKQLTADAQRYRLEAIPWPIGIDDVKKVLSAGCPVHVSINTGSAFSDVGRDGRFDAAEAPSGRHGRHAMLIVGYTGNFYTIKNSWGTEWGDQGYCYIPKNVLAASDPDFIAVLVKKQN